MTAFYSHEGNYDPDVVVTRWLGRHPYQPILEHMRTFTTQRTEKTLDEIWFVEHDPVYTQGQNGKAEHVLKKSDIPIIKTDRGGQITYHGHGQLMVYTLIDLKRKGLHIRPFVSALEQTIIEFLREQCIQGHANPKAPGVYVHFEEKGAIIEKKICSIGLRVRKGCTYHGIAFNVNMDLSPFYNINPCGFANLQMTHLKTWREEVSLAGIAQELIPYLAKQLRYNQTLVR